MRELLGFLMTPLVFVVLAIWCGRVAIQAAKDMDKEDVTLLLGFVTGLCSIALSVVIQLALELAHRSPK